MTLDFVIQFLAAAPLLVGLWLMGNKKLSGVFLCFIAEAFTTTVGITHHAWSIILIGVALFFIQGRNFLLWRKEGTPWF